MTRIVALIVLIALTGCTVHPKFKRHREISETREGKKEQSERPPDGLYSGSTSTLELLRLGRVIQKYLGAPYRGKGGNRKGFDCSAFVQRVFDEYSNIQLPRTTRDQAGVGMSVKPSSLHYGDLVFFRTDGRRISHVGIYIGYNEFVHSSSSQGVMISGLGEKYWRKRLAGARRVIP